MSNIFIGIRSCNLYQNYREAQRDTWLPSLIKLANESIVDYKYFVGNGIPQLYLEKDVVVLNVDDSMQYLTIKTKLMFEYVIDHKYDHLFFTEDDTYVVPMRLIASGFQYHDYTGNMNSKSNLGFPYMNGHAYWISRPAIQLVLDSGVLDKPGLNEDALIGATLFGMYEFNNDTRYTAYRPENGQLDPLASNQIIATHKATPDVMRQVHKAYLESFKNV
jgi:hypothetical protein